MMMRHSRTPALALLVLLITAASSLQAQPARNPNVSWKVLTPVISGKPGQVVELKVQAVIKSGWKMYSTKTYPDTLSWGAPQHTEITVGDSLLLTTAGEVKGTKPSVSYDTGFEIDTEYWKGSPTIIIPVRIARDTRKGQTVQGWVNFFFQTCDEHVCMPGVEEKLTFEVKVGSL